MGQACRESARSALSPGHGRLSGVCGRYASSRKPDDLIEEFGIVRADPSEAVLEPDYNVAPTKDVFAVLERVDREAPEGGPVRQLRVLRWGLVPSWADSPAIGSRLINARVETVAEKPAFRRALAARRCLLPADGYYEWYASPAGKQPFFVRPRDGGTLAMAGLYEFWRDPARPQDDPAAWLTTCTVLTTAAEPALAGLHDRMPLVVPRERYAAWLDPGLTDVDAVRGLLAPPPSGQLEAFPVSTAVNDVRVNGPQLLDPVPPIPTESADATLF
jgi:putative SOS response-associated peptidase YedK